MRFSPNPAIVWSMVCDKVVVTIWVADLLPLRSDSPCYRP